MRGLPSPVNGVRSDRCVDTTLRCYSLTGIPHLLGVRGFKSHLPHLLIFFLPITLLLLEWAIDQFYAIYHRCFSCSCTYTFLSFLLSCYSIILLIPTKISWGHFICDRWWWSVLIGFWYYFSEVVFWVLYVPFSIHRIQDLQILDVFVWSIPPALFLDLVHVQF